MGLVFGLDKGQCSPEDLSQAKNLVPRALQPYITCEFKFCEVRSTVFIVNVSQGGGHRPEISENYVDLELAGKFGKNQEFFFPLSNLHYLQISYL